MRTIQIHTRGCGKRKPGHLYLVSEPNEDGELPIWTDIDPPIAFSEKQFRGLIYVDLAAILAGIAYPNYLTGKSAQSHAAEILREPEIEAFGMPLSVRKRVGIGLEGVHALAPVDLRGMAASMREISRVVHGRAAANIPEFWREAQQSNWPGALAATWRLWRQMTTKQASETYPLVASVLVGLGATQDALAMQKVRKL